MADLSLACTISTGSGPLSLQAAGAYKLESSALAERQVSHRKVTATNPFVEGEYTVSSVREQVTETLAVWCYGTNALDLRNKVEVLTNALEQIQYTIIFTQDTATETWFCQPAEYTIRTTHEMRASTIALVTAQVPRRPTRTLT